MTKRKKENDKNEDAPNEQNKRSHPMNKKEPNSNGKHSEIQQDDHDTNDRMPAPNVEETNVADPANYFLYVDPFQATSNAKGVLVKSVQSFDNMKMMSLRKEKNISQSAETNFVGVIIKCNKSNVTASTSFRGEKTTRPYDRSFVLYDVMSKCGQCVAVRYADAENSNRFAKSLIAADGMTPIVGMAVICKNVEIHKGDEMLTSDNDIPLITVNGSVFPLQPLRSMWMMTRKISVSPPSTQIVTRAFTIGDAYISVSNVKVVASSCGWGTCDRSIQAATTKHSCICFTGCPGNIGKLVLSMDIALYNTKDENGVAKGDRLNTQNFVTFQSKRWTEALLGNTLTATTMSLEEWEAGKQNLVQHVNDRVKKLNNMGKFTVFGWYKNGRKKNAQEQPVATQQPSVGAGAKAKKNDGVEYFTSTEVRLHIVRILHDSNEFYKSRTPDYVFKADAQDEVFDEKQCADTLIFACPFESTD